jgi:hypothetical protein
VMDALFTCTLLDALPSRQVLQLREALLGPFLGLLSEGASSGGEQDFELALCRLELWYLPWQGAQNAWPGMLLVNGAADADARVAALSLLLVKACREEMSASLVRWVARVRGCGG